MPAYNEEKAIGGFLKELTSFLKDYDCEIIVVDDGSKDKTMDVVKSIDDKRIKLISYQPNKGKANAVRRGVEEANMEYVIFIDADGAISPDQIPRMLEKFPENDFVVGTRNLKESTVKKSAFRWVLSFGFNNYVNCLFQMKFSDYLCGFKGFKTKFAKELFSNLKSQRWIFDVELFYKAKKLKLKYFELPIVWNEAEESNMTFKAIVKMFFELISLRLRVNK